MQKENYRSELFNIEKQRDAFSQINLIDMRTFKKFKNNSFINLLLILFNKTEMRVNELNKLN